MASTSAMSPALLALLLALCSPPALLGGVSSVSSSRSSSGPEARRHLLDVRPHQRGLASESVHVVSPNQRRSAALTEPEVIDEVEDVTVRVLSARSVLIAWVDPLVQKKKEIPAGSRFYTVRFREKGESARWEQRDSAHRRLLLESLAADSMYEFSVCISHAGQQGKWSASVFQRTPESVPSGPPEHFRVKPLGGKGTVVTATWSPPEQSNGRIREYVLSYAPASKPFGAKSVTYPGTTTSATIDGLAPGERYIFKVRAVNRKGHGPQTKAVTVQMPASSTSSSRTSSDKSDSKDSEDMNLPDPDRDTRTGTQAPPVRRRGRPLSQTRSYHSIFSSVRGSNRELGSKAPDLLSTQTNHEDGRAGNTHRSTDPLAEETITANEAFVSAKPASDVDLKHSGNTEPSTKPSIQRVKQATGSPALADADEKTRSQRPSWTPRTSSIVDISKIKRLNSRNHGQIIPAQERGTARSTSSSPSPSPSHSVPLGSEHSASLTPSTPSPSSGARRNPSTSGRLTGSPSGSLNPNSRKVGISSRFHRLGQRRPAPPSSTGPHSASPTGSTINLHHTTQEPDTEQENEKRSVTKEEQSESTDNSNIPTVRPSDKTAPSPGRGSASVNQHSRAAGGSSRQDGRVPWSRTASSVGAGRPNIRGLPSHPAFPRSQNTDEKSARDVDGPVWIEPSTVNRATGSTNSVGSGRSDGGTPESVKSEESSAVTVAHRASQSNTTSLTSVPLASVNRPVVSSRSSGSRLSNRLSHVKHRRPSSASTDFVPSFFSSSSSQNISAVDQDVVVNSADAGLFARSSFKPPAAGNVSGSLGSRNRLPHPGHQPRLRKVKHGQPNLTAASGKSSSSSDESTKPSGVQQITGPDGATWVIDLDKGVLMTENGRILQDSSGKPRKVVLGEDGKTVFDEQGGPLVNSEGLALFGHGRDSRPVVNPHDKYLTLGGKPVVGLDRAKPRVTTTIPPEPVEATTAWAAPTCPPGLHSRLDTNGFQIGGILNCYSEGDVLQQTTALPLLKTGALSSRPTSERDAAGRRRFTAPYVNYVQKDPGAPCSLTEALEYLQVDVLARLMEKDQQSSGVKQPPKNKPHNVTVVAMEGCHSFVILDWARPLEDDMVSGYMVQSASYDDVLNNRWSTRASSGTHLPVENLKPNSRYYFRVQAKNVVGLGPVSETLTYVTESDDPLLIERPPGGEPVWVPFSFRFNAAHSSCKGSQFVKRTWYRKFVGVVLCNSLRYKIFMSDGLRETFYSLADSAGHGEDHCQFVDSHLDGRTGRHELSDGLPTAQGFFRSDRQEPVRFGPVGKRTPHPFVGWYECGVPIPGKW